MTATLYIVEQDDDVTSAFLVPILDFYQSILVNSAWLIAVVIRSGVLE